MAEPYYSLRVREVIDETAEAKSLVFDIPPEHAQAFRYKPGQFLTLRIAYDGRNLLRCYSLASSPLLPEPLRVTVKRIAHGRVSNRLCDRIKVGDVVEIRSPAGHFTPHALDDDFLLFAGGSGITPIFSIIKSSLIAGRGRLRLIYANRDQQSIIYRDQLDALIRQHAERLEVICLLDAVDGPPTLDRLAELSRAWTHADCYVCGPEAFMDCALDALRGLAVAPARIHLER
ncbi:MAG TPA: FAD-binding oxidoreductase, partial [Candidatus Binatus sp.]|nr:FAD-binding oxidoreductase [Candidatus Binatus sp.]